MVSPVNVMSGLEVLDVDKFPFFFSRLFFDGDFGCSGGGDGGLDFTCVSISFPFMVSSSLIFCCIDAKSVSCSFCNDSSVFVLAICCLANSASNLRTLSVSLA